MTRSTELWVGKHDDEKVPQRVRLRIFEREGGRCWISGRKIMPGEAWELDHRIALVNGGRHAEDNLFPALKDKHREKTNDDLALKSKLARIAAKHTGAWTGSSRKIPTHVNPWGKAKAAPKDNRRKDRA